MHLKYIIGFVLLALLSLNCSDSSSPEPNRSVKDIFPLNVGNRWAYHLLEYSSTGSLRTDDTSVFSIPGQQTFQGQAAFEFVPDGDTSKMTLLYYVGNSDVYSAPSATRIFHWFHYPMNVGETFTLQDTVDGSGSISKKILILRSDNESITVPAGTFTCFHFDQIDLEGTVDKQDTNSLSKQYYALGKGLIKQDDYAHDASFKQYLRAVRELTSYEIK